MSRYAKFGPSVGVVEKELVRGKTDRFRGNALAARPEEKREEKNHQIEGTVGRLTQGTRTW